MNRLVALMLLFAVPAFAQQQASLVPAYEQSNDPAVPLKVVETSVSWKPWAIAGGAAFTVAVVVAILAASLVPTTTTPRRSDFACAPGGCDGFINAPPL